MWCAARHCVFESRPLRQKRNGTCFFQVLFLLYAEGWRKRKEGSDREALFSFFFLSALISV